MANRGEKQKCGIIDKTLKKCIIFKEKVLKNCMFYYKKVLKFCMIWENKTLKKCKLGKKEPKRGKNLFGSYFKNSFHSPQKGLYFIRGHYYVDDKAYF